jgi:hypothetical protein
LSKESSSSSKYEGEASDDDIDIAAVRLLATVTVVVIAVVAICSRGLQQVGRLTFLGLREEDKERLRWGRQDRLSRT